MKRFADVDPAISAVAMCADWPVVILRSFGKFYGLAGLRLGFAIGAPDVIERIAAGHSAHGRVPGPALLDRHGGAARSAMGRSHARRLANSRPRKLDQVLAKAALRLPAARRCSALPGIPMR